MISIEQPYPELNRAAFLIERADVPKYLPPICPETAQILAAMVAVMAKNTPQENST